MPTDNIARGLASSIKSSQLSTTSAPNDGEVLSYNSNELKWLSKNDMLKISNEISNNSIDAFSDYDSTGRPIISSPDSLIYMFASGFSAVGTNVVFERIGSKGGYNSTGGNDSEGIICTDGVEIGFYPYYANRFDTNRIGSARWKTTKKGFPSGVFEYTFVDTDSDPNKTIRFLAWVKNNVLYIWSQGNVNDLKLAMHLKSSEGTKSFSGGYEKPDSQGYIAIQDNTSGLWISATCNVMDRYEVSSDAVNVLLSLDTNKTTITNSECYFGFGRDNMASVGEVLFCFSINTTKTTSVNSVLGGLVDYKTQLLAVEEDWNNYFSGLENRFTNLTIEQKTKLFMCLQQIRSHSFNGYLPAGMPNWYCNFIRDTAWTAYGISKLNHTNTNALARSLLDWFGGVDSWANANNFSIDKVKRTSANVNQTDSAPTFLLAIAEVYSKGGFTISSNLKIQIDACLEYCKTNYSSTDKHVLALHSHDYWDDYRGGEIDPTLVKYESMVDVLWIAALEAIVTVYTALEDTTNADYCTATSEGLRLGLSDYRNNDGSLSYAIKTNDLLYSTIVALPGTLYAAWLLEDIDCINWLLSNNGQQIKVYGGFTEYPLNHSNLVTSAARSDIWSAHLPIVALIAAKYGGDWTLINDICMQFNISGFPEYSEVDGLTNLKRYNSGAYTFPWADAMYLLMCATLES